MYKAKKKMPQTREILIHNEVNSFYGFNYFEYQGQTFVTPVILINL